MNRYIYFTNSAKDLKHSTQEHFILAGLGSITKLPHGYVSNKANEFFHRMNCEHLEIRFYQLIVITMVQDEDVI